MTTECHKKKSVFVPQLAWWGDIEAELTFPDAWDVTECRMAGHEATPLDDAGFRKAFANPIGCPTIRELAVGKKNVVILFDDMSRGTKTFQIVPYVLEELAAAGVPDENIQFICAPGTHGSLSSFEFGKKLGEDIIARFNVYNHNIYENCTYVGTTSRGTAVSLNAEFMKADLKIGIGAIVPHPNCGFGGGGKLILPGIASLETILHNHGPVRTNSKNTGIDDNTGMGRYEHNAQLLDTLEACKLSGLHVKVDAIMNIHRDATALFVGEPEAAYYAGAKAGLTHYHSPTPDRPNIVVANCYAKINEVTIAKTVGQAMLPDEGGSLVLITNNPWGEVVHYLRRRFGDHTMGQGYRPPTLSPKVKRFIVQMPYKNKASIDWLAPEETVTWAKTWDDVLAVLKQDHPGAARVAVVPDATMQYFDVQATLHYL
jgi:nickel-dependent lactate racemase